MLSKDNPMFASLKDKALKLQADAQIAAQSSLDSAKQKVAASVDVAKLQKLKEDALAKGSELKESAMTRVASGSLLGAGPSVRGPSPNPADDEAMSADEATAEKERLVGGPDLRAGVSALGSRFFTGARSVRSKGVESLRSAGSAACASGTEKLTALKAAKDGAKERCGEALSAASAVSGVSLGGLGEKMAIGGKAREPPKTALGRLCARCPALTYKQRLVGAVACMAVGWLLSLSSLLSFTRLLLGNPLPFAYKCAAPTRSRMPHACTHARTMHRCASCSPCLVAGTRWGTSFRSERRRSSLGQRGSAATCCTRAGAPRRCYTLQRSYAMPKASRGPSLCPRDPIC